MKSSDLLDNCTAINRFCSPQEKSGSIRVTLMIIY